MMKIKSLFISTIPAFFCLLTFCNVNLAHPGETQESHSIVPDKERDTAQSLAAEGPTVNQRIESVEVRGVISLEGEFTTLQGRVLRAREITILPNGHVAVHQHQSRPGMAYILEGELIEYRNDQSAPITRKVGDISVEKTGVIHWWANTSSTKARVLVIDLIQLETDL